MNGFFYPTKMKLIFFLIIFLIIFISVYFIMTRTLVVCQELGCLSVEQQALRYSLYLLPITLGISYFLASLLHSYLYRLQS